MEIMDTTLRDGEQTEGVSFTAEDKLEIAKYLLEKVKVDAIEVASARVSEGEFNAVSKIISWAKENNYLNKIEILGFVDNEKSVDWIYDARGRVINLLVKGSLKHVEGQLKKSKEEHLEDVKKVIKNAKEKDIKVNVYLEDWSNGMKESKDYVFFLIDNLDVNRIMLADTLGVLNYEQTYEFIEELIKKYPKKNFDFHGHNDYDLAVANSIAAAKAGATRLHVTVNGLGERAGNTKLSSLIVALKDLSEFDFNVDEKELVNLSLLVESLSGIRIASNTPIIGENVFTQNCGVHADGDKKGNLYQNKLIPERFGKERKYSLGKTSGIASIDQNLRQLDINLDKEQEIKVLEKIKEIADKKQTISREDLPYIIEDVIGMPKENKIELIDFEFKLNKNKLPEARVKLKINNEEKEGKANGDGQYDAFMNALKKIMNIPELLDYSIRIPPGGKTSALVETTIKWKFENKIYKTIGVDSDQLLAAIESTIKMLNIIST